MRGEGGRERAADCRASGKMFAQPARLGLKMRRMQPERKISLLEIKLDRDHFVVIELK